MISSHLEHEQMIDVITGASEDSGALDHLSVCVTCSEEYALLAELTSGLADSGTWAADEGSAGELPFDSAEVDKSWKIFSQRFTAEMRSGKPENEPSLAEIEATLTEARKRHDQDANESLAMIDEARTKLITILAEEPSAVLVRLLLARAWKERSNALRVLGDYPKALEALEHADATVSNLAAAAIDRGSHSYTRAIVLFKMGQLERALLSVQAAVAVFLDYGDLRRYGHAQMLEAAILFESGRYREARDMCLGLIKQTQIDNDLDATARLFSNIANCYAELGDLNSASTFFLQAMHLYKRLGIESETIRVRWSMGRIFVRKGEIDEGLSRLRQAQAEFEAASQTTDAALVALDIAEALLGIHEFEQVVTIARQLVNRFLVAEMKPSAIAAVEYLQRASEERVARPPLAGAIRTYLERLPVNPQLEFDPSLM